MGIGGPLEEVARLATEATARPIDQRHPEADIAQLEEELRAALNMSQIGPMGMGGDTTAVSYTHLDLPSSVLHNQVPAFPSYQGGNFQLEHPPVSQVPKMFLYPFSDPK